METAQLNFSEESHAIQAAVAGQGIALASLALVKDELLAGHIVQPFNQTISGFRYHLLSEEDEKSAAVLATINWLVEEARGMDLASALTHHDNLS